ncbi:hypothetical protein CYMTET_39480 [Cymbomonas tetramitiformis]|uniref:Complex 1 LYR protein domain-containing protein n=1 Tax=Cymbomonas tetramitiformis TaxID=36881 RepID=A0AAE0CC38_9CHLO|nr:hypothetical protein CYMTET_39480 [Cymbomonas tetramitiformis]
MSRVINLYRQLLRERRTLFNGDTDNLRASLTEIRSHFENARFEQDESAIAKMVKDGQDAAQFMRNNVVQGKLNERGNYGQVLSF